LGSVNQKTRKKDVEPVLSLVPRLEGSRIALFVETSNAENPTPNDIYGMYNHYMGRSRCLVFNEQSELARFSSRQNQSVQKTPFVNKFCLKPPKVVQSRCKVRKKTNTKEKDGKI
jgi:hypothetical protein